MNERETQPAKAPLPISESFESERNVTTESVRQTEKQFDPSDSTDDGMQIDDSIEQLANPPSSIRERRT
jgi:hypothetical protein